MDFFERFSFGDISRGDAVITSMKLKGEADVSPGDLLKLTESEGGDDPKEIEVEKYTNGDEGCFYGVATFGIEGNVIPVVTRGHVVANLEDTDFSAFGVGECLECLDGTTCCCVMVVAKYKVLNENNEEKDAFELKLG